MFEELRSKERRPNGPRCWNCGELGHIRRRCKNPSKEDKSDKGHKPTCYNNAPEVTIQAVMESSSIYVDGKISERPVKLLIDIGATRTIVRPDILEGVGKTLPVIVRLRTATGEEIPTHGMKKIMMELGEMSFGHQVLVADIIEEMILGMDIIKKYGFQINMTNVIRIGNVQIPFRKNEEATIEVLSTQDITLPGQAESIVKGYLDGDLRNGCIRLIETDCDNSLGKGLLVGKILVKTRNEVPVRILNTNSYPVTLKKDIILGKCSEVSYVTRSICDTKEEVPKKKPGVSSN